MNERLLELLYRSFDDELSEEDQTELTSALSLFPELLEEKKRIIEMRQMIKGEAVHSFKPFFAAQVMQRIKSESIEQEDFLGSLIWVFRRIALAGTIAILLLLANSVLVEKNNSLDSVLGMPQLTLEDTWQLDIIVEEGK
ncbi:MAG: hypothetical protein ACE5JB_02395 [bacterium]